MRSLFQSSKDKGKERAKDADKPSGREQEPSTSRSNSIRRPTADKVVKGGIKDEWPMYSNTAADYDILGEIGFGASSVVHRAIFKPLNAECAIKIINIDRMSMSGLERLRREAQLMSLAKHPNVLRVRGDWMAENKLHIACRFMRSGSILDVMQYHSPDGLTEICVATILKQCLEGINYFHINGWIHRDIKAANLLVDDDGTVLLADFGVASTINTNLALSSSASPSSFGNTYASRKSFVGTPSWMAPEVITGEHSHSTPADIWSFGITAVELCTGHAPNSLAPAALILQRTVMDDAPSIDVEKFGESLRGMVGSCLQKDPAKRPTAEKLLTHAFFKQAKPKSYLQQALLKDLPPLENRQTRHRVNTIRTLALDGSWDFSSNPVSPESPDFPTATDAVRVVDGVPISPRKPAKHRASVSFTER